VWFVLHGYRQLARRFIRRFDVVADGTRLVVAPEALSRFYVEGEVARHGPASVVGATWMTREDRESEIRDYVGYLDALARRVLADVAGAPPVTVLGFSQGVATAARWVTYGDVRPRRIVLWGDSLPPDLDMERAAGRLARADLVIVLGSEDRSVSELSQAEEAGRLAAAGIAHRRVTYAGGHDVDADALASLLVG
jgi:predicted esterase